MVATSRRHAEATDGDLPLIGETPRRGDGHTTITRVDSCAWILGLVARAIDRTMPRKAAAIDMQMDRGQLTRELTGDGHLSIKRLGALPEQFWLTLADELREHFGMLDRAELISQGESLIDRGRQLLAPELLDQEHHGLRAEGHVTRREGG